MCYSLLSIEAILKSIQHIVILDLSENAIEKTIERLEDYNVSAHFYKVTTTIELEEIIDSEDIDLIILELELEAYKGYQTFKAAMEVADEVPILVYSQAQNEVIIAQVLRAGALDYLVKTETNAKQLARAVRNAGIRHQLAVNLSSAKIDLEAAQRRSKEAQKIARFGDWTIDIVTGEMNWSDTMFELFNLPAGKNVTNREDFIGLVYTADKEAVEHFFNEVIKLGELQETSFRIKQAKIGFQYLKIRAKVQMYDSIGGMVMVGTCQDVTKEVQSQSALIAQHFSDKTAKIHREMMAHLGFNIRTKMGSLVSLFYLFEETVASKDQRSLLGGMRTSFDGLNEDLHQFLNSTVASTKELKVNLQQIRLRNFLDGFVKFVKVKEANDLSLELSTADKLPDHLLFDGDKLQQVLLNVIHAFGETASSNQKPISIAITSKKEKASRYTLKVSLEFDGYFPFAQEEEIFVEPEAFLAKAAVNTEEYEGVDTDLAIAARLIKIMGGKLDFAADVKRTKFSFSMPVTKIKEGQQHNTAQPIFALNILLVEDHIINQIATRKVLEKWGDVTVDIAKNGKEAIEKVDNKNYDLVLMDLQMPILSGVAATRVIRKSDNLPIIALTAHASEEERKKCLDAGMNDYITKPFKPKELYQIINQTINRLAEKGA